MLTFFLPNIVFAQFFGQQEVVDGAAPQEKSGATANACFDYYKFGSVVASVETQSPALSLGGTARLLVRVENKNDYPVSDVLVYAKVFYRPSNKSPLLTEEFVLVNNLSLSAKSKKEVAFDWKIPSYLKTGSYRLASYVVVNNKFNLSGLSFTDEVVGSATDFVVGGNNTGGVHFNKSQVQLNGKPYYFAAFIPSISGNNPIEIKTEIVNSSKKSYTVPVVWKAYKWDSLSGENLIDTKSEIVTLGAGEKNKLTYTLTNTSESVYYVTAETESPAGKSIISVRFARGGITTARINFMGLSRFPLNSEEKNTAFVCFHGMGPVSTTTDQVEIKVRLIDHAGNVISTKKYNPGLTTKIQAVFLPITKKIFGGITLEVTLTHNGKQIEKESVVYRCQGVNPEDCNSVPILQKVSTSIKTGIFIGLGILILIIISGAFYLKKSKSNKKYA